MSKLNFQEITQKNFYEVIKLSNTLTDAQQKCVAPNAFSIGEGSVNPNAYYRGIFLDDTAVGFFMLYVSDVKNGVAKSNDKFYLWRFMIGYEYQNKHYGVQALNHIVEMGKKLGFDELSTSCHIGEERPYKFYLKYGFIDTGKVDGGEQVLSLKLV